ncbi:MAG: ABC transporter permease [Candidatus Aenigmatarchaeota archaeon]
MRVSDAVSFSVRNLSQRGLRSWLTILGIVIGIAAVISILSVGEGMRESIYSQLSSLGGDLITISPGATRARGEFADVRTFLQARFGGALAKLNDKDIQIIKSIPEVKYVSGMISGRAELSYLGEKTYVLVQGVNPTVWKDIVNLELEEGRNLMPGDVDVVVIGNYVANRMFKNPIPLNSRISVGGRSFRVVGILKASTGVGGMIGIDNSIYIPLTSAKTLLNITSNEYNSILVKVSDVEVVDEVEAKIDRLLMLSRKVTEETKDYTITSVKSIQERVLSVMGTLNFFLAGIAAISLIVGAVGIANTMFMSVMERTRQIGTLKALGATDGEVMLLFLIESGLIGLVGGLIGIFFGLIASGIISEIGIRMVGMTGVSRTVVHISPQLALFTISFSVLIGVLSGLLPARRAAKLQPVEALRYE